MVWVGVQKDGNEWKTVKGQVLTSIQSNWAPNEPSPTGGDCAVADKALGFKWRTENCFLSFQYFCALRSANCPMGYEWIPALGRTCLKVTQYESFTWGADK